MVTSSLVMLILPCCVTFSNSFSTVSIHFYCDQLGCPTSCSQIDSSASGITCSCLIFPFNSSYKAFLLFLKVLFCWYCFTLDSQHFSFNVLADIHCLSSSMTVLKPSAFILYFFFRPHFILVLPFFHHLLNQSSILLKSFLKIAISFSILHF